MFKFKIQALGCPMRAIEAERIKLYFIANNGKEVSTKKDADIIAIFSCAIIKEKEDESISYIEKTIESGKRVIVFGGVPEMSKDRLAAIFTGEALATKDLGEVDKFFPEFKIKFGDIQMPNICHNSLEYANYYIKQFKKHIPKNIFSILDIPQIITTSRGCPNNCSYCNVRKALGPIQSSSFDKIKDNYLMLLKKHHKSFIFLGDDTGAYGLDNNKDFGNLLLDLQKVTGQKKNINWIIDNLHPQWLIKYIDTICKLAESGLLIEITIPLQAATDRLLQLMRRKHNINDFVAAIKKLRKAKSNIKLSTHFIIGFPSEDEENIKAIKELVETKLFDQIFLLRYFESKNTDSYDMIPKITPHTIHRRLIELGTFIESKGILCEYTDGFDENDVDCNFGGATKQ